MNADLTFNSVVFAKQYDSKEETPRQSIARGINTPDQLITRGREYTDQKTKVPGQELSFRVNRVDIDAELQKIESSVNTVIRVPSTATQAQIDALVANYKAVVADANFVANVLAGQR